MPTFFLMLLELTQEGFRKLESICRTFLWGLNVEQNPKVPLVTWEKILQSKLLRGLGSVNFQSQATMFKLRYVSKILKNHSSEWVVMAKQLIREALRHGTFRRETRH
jgi:hypothetical protein